MKTYGLTSANIYPYVAMKSSCPANLTPVSRLASYKALPAKNPAAMLQALKSGPIAVAVTVDNGWYSYAGGIYTSSACGGQINHAVVVVGAGYDSDQQAPYW